MKMLAIALIVVLFFSGCSNEPVPCTPNNVYVKSEVPKLRILYKVKPYEITDYTYIDVNYTKVNTAQLKKAAAVSRKRASNLDFSDRQAIRFNTEFATKVKDVLESD